MKRIELERVRLISERVKKQLEDAGIKSCGFIPDLDRLLKAIRGEKE